MSVYPARKGNKLEKPISRRVYLYTRIRIIFVMYLIKRDLQERGSSESFAISVGQVTLGFYSQKREKRKEKKGCAHRVHLEAAAQFSTSKYVSRVQRVIGRVQPARDIKQRPRARRKAGSGATQSRRTFIG